MDSCTVGQNIPTNEVKVGENEQDEKRKGTGGQWWDFVQFTLPFLYFYPGSRQALPHGNQAENMFTYLQS